MKKDMMMNLSFGLKINSIPPHSHMFFRFQVFCLNNPSHCIHCVLWDVAEYNICSTHEGVFMYCITTICMHGH